MATPLPNTQPANLSQYYQDPAIEQARAGSETAGANAAQYSSAGNLLPYKLKDAILQKLNYNQDLISKQSESQANYFAAPSQARVDYQNVWDPQQREALVTQARTQAYAPYSTYTDLLKTRMGSVADIIGAGTASFKSLADLASAEADRARQRYVDLFSKAQALTGTLTAQEQMNRADAWQKYQAAESARTWAEEMAFKQKQLEQEKELAQQKGTSPIALNLFSGGSDWEVIG